MQLKCIRWKTIFVSGALKLGHSEEKAKEVFAIMEEFAGYGLTVPMPMPILPWLHQMAYFKVHYPDVFFDVMLTIRAAIIWQMLSSLILKSAPLSINTIPFTEISSRIENLLGNENIKGLWDLAYWSLIIVPWKRRRFIYDFNQYHKLPLLTPLVELGCLISLRRIDKGTSQFAEFVCLAGELGSLFADLNHSWTEAEDFSQAENMRSEIILLCRSQ